MTASAALLEDAERLNRLRFRQRRRTEEHRCNQRGEREQTWWLHGRDDTRFDAGRRHKHAISIPPKPAAVPPSTARGHIPQVKVAISFRTGRSRQCDLSDIAGTWRTDRAFDRAVADQHKVDRALWK